MFMNWTIEVVMNLIAVPLFFFGFYVSLRQILKGQNYHFYYFSTFAWLGYMLFFLFTALAVILLSVTLLKIALLISSFADICFLGKVDTLKRESVEPIKLAILSMLIVMGVIFIAFFPNAVYISTFVSGDLTVKYDLYLGAIIGLQYLLPVVYYVIYTKELLAKAPQSLKHDATRYFLGVFFCLIAIITMISGIMQVLPGILALLGAIGAVLMVSAYGKQPKLLFILPFKALRLVVMDTESGISLFTHTWNAGSNLIDDDLFTGMLQGINSIVKESVKRGAVQEIRMADAIIMTSYDNRYPIACVLIATNPSKSLRDSLHLFAQQFTTRYNTCFDNYNEVSQFSGASDMINACFPFVPVYD